MKKSDFIYPGEDNFDDEKQEVIEVEVIEKPEVNKLVNKEKIPRGIPSKYKPEYDFKVYKLCLLGATDDVIASIFEVNVDTLNQWKKVHPSFYEKMKEGKTDADSDVAMSMYKLANGFVQKVKKAFVVSDGKDAGSHIEIVEVDQFVPPNPFAGFRWLQNRNKNWKDVKEVHSHKYDETPDKDANNISEIVQVLEDFSKKAPD